MARRPHPIPKVTHVPRHSDDVDPTANVISLNESSSRRLEDLLEAGDRRQDDLRIVVKELHEARLSHIREIGDYRSNCAKEIATLREGYTEKLSAAESSRLNSIRQIDREDVNKTAAAAQTAIAALATNTTALADTLRNQVASVANAAETRRSADNAEITKRLSALELASSEGKGKQTIADPRLDKLMDVVEKLQSGSYRGEGAGNQAATGKADSQFNSMMMIGVFGLLITIILGYMALKPSAVVSVPLRNNDQAAQ